MEDEEAGLHSVSQQATHFAHWDECQQLLAMLRQPAAAADHSLGDQPQTASLSG